MFDLTLTTEHVRWQREGGTYKLRGANDYVAAITVEVDGFDVLLFASHFENDMGMIHYRGGVDCETIGTFDTIEDAFDATVTALLENGLLDPLAFVAASLEGVK